jgi:tripartite-type tricarboxylate transporter receptor subunit TctC
MTISMASHCPFVLVAHPAPPVKNVKELVALAESEPNAVNYSSGGTNGPFHCTAIWPSTPAIQDRLYREWVTAVKSPEVTKRIRGQVAEPGGNTPVEFAAFFKTETAERADVAKHSGTKVD